MERIEPTRRVVLQVWWALAWRMALATVLLLLLQGLLIGSLVGMFDLSPESADKLARTVAYLLGVPLILAASWETLYRIFDKRIGDIEIAVLRRTVKGEP